MLRSGVLQLQRWGVLDRIIGLGTPPVRNVMLGFGEERIPIRLSTDHGVEALYAPRRHLLDSALLEAAVEEGVEARTGVRVTDLTRNRDGRVVGVTMQGASGESAVSARVVIGADGVHSRVAELAGAKAYRAHRPTNAVHYAYFSGIEHAGFWFQFTPGVNAGMIQTNDDAVLAFVARPAGQVAAFRADPDAEFRRLLAHGGSDLAAIVATGERLGPYRGTPGLPGFMRTPWGPGWALVGDAGYTKDPISAHGMSDALRDAELCARAVDRSLCTPDVAGEALADYHRVRDALSVRMFAESTALAAYGWGAAEASRRMRIISESVRHECEALLALPAWGVAVSSAA
jgi:flavin-dependent dehydrogenase